MVVLLLVGGFVTVYAALRALAALLALPHQARRWRVQQKSVPCTVHCSTL